MLHGCHKRVPTGSTVRLSPIAYSSARPGATKRRVLDVRDPSPSGASAALDDSTYETLSAPVVAMADVGLVLAGTTAPSVITRSTTQ